MPDTSALPAPPAPAVLVLGPAQLADHALLAGGAFGLRTYQPAADVRAIRAGGSSVDGRAWPRPVALEVATEAGAALVGSRLELRHPEGVLLGVLEVDDVGPTGDGRVALSGPLEIVAAGVHYDHTDLRVAASALRASPFAPFLAVPTGGVLRLASLAHVTALAHDLARPVLLMSLVGDRGAADHGLHTLVRAHRLAVAHLAAADVEVVHVIAPLDPTSPPEMVAIVAAGHGASHVVLDGGTAGASAADPEVILLDWPGGGAPADPREVVHEELPADVAALLRRRHPADGREGVALMFTGLSGSGKSTVAGAVVARIAAESDRRVTVLDGDLVRQHLSSELSFSREHRDLNVTRIGAVATEVVRHGGIAVCAPIAPYAATRARVRAMVEAVGTFLLIHVSTPLEVCEARDRKGLYAKARAGEIPSFTGISDPYEVPLDADLTIDTSVVDVGAAAEQVVAALRDRGILEPAPADGPA